MARHNGKGHGGFVDGCEACEELREACRARGRELAAQTPPMTPELRQRLRRIFGFDAPRPPSDP